MTLLRLATLIFGFVAVLLGVVANVWLIAMAVEVLV
jgi:hypothetical protein